MFRRDDKHRLYQIIQQYLSKKIDASTFCDEFYYSYDLELDCDTLTSDENQAFDELSNITSRFSNFEEDHKKYPGVFYTELELKKKIVETKNRLINYYTDFENNYSDCETGDS